MGAVGLDKGRETRTNSRGRDLPFGTDMSQDDRCGTKGFGSNAYDWVGFLARTELHKSGGGRIYTSTYSSIRSEVRGKVSSALYTSRFFFTPSPPPSFDLVTK